MVERYTLSSLDELEAQFGAPAPAGCVPRFNIAALQLAPICVASGIVVARWGLLPPWRGHGGKRDPHVLHAPIAAIDSVPVLRNAFKRQRCLVIADGFFAWRRANQAARKPAPLWIHPRPDPAQPGARTRTIAFAGVAATHRDDGQPSFAIIVGPASPAVASAIAPGMTATSAPAIPVVVATADRAAWLAGPAAAARAILTAAPIDWRAEPVSTWVNAIEHDDATCIEPVGNPRQGELF
jgi:putative SOS response-associated peptidase YedK